MAKDLYDTLGIPKQATEKEIRQAYRRLARQYHPDVNPGNPEAEARFKEVNAAFEVLSDADKRRKYDRYGDQWQHADEIEAMRRQQRAGARAGGAPGQPGVEYEFGDMNDLGEMFGGGALGGLFGMFRGGGRSGNRSGMRQAGRDIEHAVEVTLEEAYRGASRTLELLDESGGACEICGGAGSVAGAVCHGCGGSGRASAVRRIEVQIPAGVETGTRVRVTGKGAPGLGGGPAGDLFLRITVRPHARFERKGDDLHISIDVPVADAALGGEVRVPTLKGKALALKVPPGTQGGRVFRLAGQGMARRAGGFGDLHARVRLVLPEPLSDEQRAIFEQLRRTAEPRDPGSARSSDGRSSDGRSSDGDVAS